MENDEDYIRRLAHQIWESEGRPEGQAARHWAMAKELAKGHVDKDVEPVELKKSKDNSE